MLSAKSTDLEVSSAKRHSRSLSVVGGSSSGSSILPACTTASSSSSSTWQNNSSNNSRQNRSFSVNTTHSAMSALPPISPLSSLGSTVTPLLSAPSTGCLQQQAQGTPETNSLCHHHPQAQLMVSLWHSSEEQSHRSRIAGSFSSSAAIPPVMAEQRRKGAAAEGEGAMTDTAAAADASAPFLPSSTICSPTFTRSSRSFSSSSLPCTSSTFLASPLSTISSSSLAPTSDHPTTPSPAPQLAKPPPLTLLLPQLAPTPPSPAATATSTTLSLPDTLISSFTSHHSASPPPPPPTNLATTPQYQQQQPTPQPIGSMATLPPLPLMTHAPLFTYECLDSITFSSSAMTSPASPLPHSQLITPPQLSGAASSGHDSSCSLLSSTPSSLSHATACTNATNPNHISPAHSAPIPVPSPRRDSNHVNRLSTDSDVTSSAKRESIVAAVVSPAGALSPSGIQGAAGGHHLYSRPRSITARSPVSSPAFDGFTSSRRGSKDSSDSATGTFLDDLVNQLTTPDYDNPHDQIARTNVFLMIYRKFLRPRDLLEMFIDRFEDQGDVIDTDLDEQDLASLEARDTRLRICTCLHHWLKHYPNDFIHPQTRQRLAAFLRERVALFPYLQNIYTSLLPLSSIHYFNTWRALNESSATSEVMTTASLTAGSSVHSSNSSVSGDGDQDRPSTPAPAMSYEEMDEDKEWGLYDKDEELPEARLPQQQGQLIHPLTPYTPTTMSDSSSLAGTSPVDTLAPFPLIPNAGRRNSRTLAHLPRDRRSSTGSLTHNYTSPSMRESILGARRGSASSVSSHPGYYHLGHYHPLPGSFAEGDVTPMQLQPIGTIPIITKRSSSQAYRQRALSSASTGSTQALATNDVAGVNNTSGNASGQHTPLRKTPSLTSVGPGLFEGLLPHITHTHTPPPPLPSANVNSILFMDIPNKAVADQLTCVEFGLFRKLKPRDMLRQVWKSSKGSVAFQACIAHFNFISSWVGTMILAPPKVKNRAKMMEKFISIAKILREAGNYNTTMAIVGAMNTSSIHRLFQTREMLQSKEIWSTFKELEKLMSSERSFAEYRAALKTTEPPCIPYLGVHLGDLLSVSEGNKDFRQDGSIHWQKFVLMADVISTVISFQSTPYDIDPDLVISRIITDTHVLDDEELYTKSVGMEPNKLNHSRSLSFKLFL